jgi:DNA-binding NarL/FixJ family response regulator
MARTRADRGRLAGLRDELAAVGADEFCRRRYTRDAPIPKRLSLALIAAPVVAEWEMRRIFARNWTAKRKRALTLIADGKSNKQIAADLGISHAGATNHVRCVIHLLKANNRAHAVHLAHQQHLLS